MAVTMTLYKTLYGSNPVYIFSGVESGKAADKVNDAIKAMADACEDLEEGVTGVGISTATINSSGHLVLTKTDTTTVDAGVAKGGDGVGISTATINSSGHLVLTKTDTTTVDAGVAKGGDGVGISTATINSSGHLVLTKTDSTTVDAGVAKGGDGVGISTATINSSGHLVLTKTDSTTVDAGSAIGPQGQAGASSFTASTDATATPSVTVSDGASLQCTSSALTSVTVTEPASGWTFGKYAHLYFVSSATAPTFACPAAWYCKGDDCDDGDFEPAASTTYDLFIFRTVDTTVVSVMART